MALKKTYPASHRAGATVFDVDTQFLGDLASEHILDVAGGGMTLGDLIAGAVAVSGILSFTGANGVLKFEFAEGADADTTYSVGGPNILYRASYTTERTYTLSTTGAQAGMFFLIATGDNTNSLNVQGSGLTDLKLAVGKSHWGIWVYDGSAWRRIADAIRPA